MRSEEAWLPVERATSSAARAGSTAVGFDTKQAQTSATPVATAAKVRSGRP